MNAGCTTFDRWLDAGRPAADASAAHAHASACARCAAALELEQLLAVPLETPAPAGFTAEVMARVRVPQRARTFVAPIVSLVEVPWWLALPVQPGVVLGMFATAVLAWGREALWRLAVEFGAWAAAISWPSPPVPHLPAIAWFSQLAAGQPLAQAAAILAVSVAAMALSWPLYRWTEHLVGGFMPRVALRAGGAAASH